MKPFRFLLLLACGLPLAVSGQVYEFGASSYISNNWLVNNNVLDAGNQQGMSFSLDYTAGIHGVMFFAGSNGVTLGVNGGRFMQEYSGFDEVGGYPHFYRGETRLTTINIPVGWRLGMNDFIELGVQTTLVTGADYEYRDSDGTQKADVSGAFTKTNFGVYAGFGSNAEITEKILITTGMRFSYGLSDLGGVDGYGNDLTKRDDTELYNPSADQGLYNAYQKTNPVSVGFQIGIIYRIVPKVK